MNKVYNYEDSKRRALSAALPAFTDSYTPVSHHVFIGTLRNALARNGYVIEGERLYSNENGNKLIGFYDVEIPTLPAFTGREVRMMIGFKNSYDKSMRVGIAVGGTVVVCGNGAIMGDMMTFTRKHTGSVDVDIQEKVQEAISKLQSSYQRMLIEVSVMKDVIVTNTQKAEILGRLYFKEKLLTPRQASIVRKELYSSEHFSGNTLWDLYNNVTEALKWSHPSRQMEDHIKLHKFMAQIAGIIPEEPEIAEVIVEPAVEVSSVGIPVESVSDVKLRAPTPMDMLLDSDYVEDEVEDIIDDEEEEEEGRNF